MADVLRSQATEKLSPERTSVFLSRSMDLWLAMEKRGRVMPIHSMRKGIPDLARNMQSKGDRESAFKYAFEALKIVHVLAARKPDLKAELLDSTRMLLLSCFSPSRP